MGVTNDFVGKALKFPLEIDSAGAAVITEGVDTIKQSITNVLSWDQPRFFLAPYFSKVHEVLEEPNTGVSHNLIRAYTIEAIKEWEKRIDLVSVEVTSDDESKVEVEIIFRLRENQLEETMVYPFYKVE